MTRLLCVALACAFSHLASAASEDFDAVQRHEYFDLQLRAYQDYSGKRYPDAFAKYQRLACAGDKNSQGILGEMFLTGTGVKRDDEKGYIWFKLAAEFTFAPYRNFVSKIEKNLTPAQQAELTERVEAARKMYGMTATSISCEVRSSQSFSSNLRDAVACTPRYFGKDILMHRCGDDGGLTVETPPVR